MTNLKYILSELHRTLTLVEGWSQKGEISSIERDLALDKLKRLYEEVRFAQPDEEYPSEEPQPMPVASSEEPAEEPLSEEELHEEELFEEEPAVVDFDELMLVEEEAEPELEELPEEVVYEAPIDEEPEQSEQPEEEPVSVSEEPEESAESILEPIAEPEPELESELEPKAEEVAEEVASEEAATKASEEAPVVQNSLFDLSEIPVHRRSSRRVLMSLYNDAPTPKQHTEPKPEPEPQPETPLAEALQRELDTAEPEPTKAENEVEPEPLVEPEASPVEVATEEPEEEATFEEYRVVTEPITHPATEQTAVLGEVIQPEHPTLADTLTAPAPMTSTLAPSGESLRKMIALNDRFLLRSELFADNDSAYEAAIEQLDNMSSLDDCMIYMAENYSWNANSEAAKLLFELLERKYGL